MQSRGIHHDSGRHSSTLFNVPLFPSTHRPVAGSQGWVLLSVACTMLCWWRHAEGSEGDVPLADPLPSVWEGPACFFLQDIQSQVILLNHLWPFWLMPPWGFLHQAGRGQAGKKIVGPFGLFSPRTGSMPGGFSPWVTC